MSIRTWIAGSALAQAFSAPALVAKNGELFAGVEKPSITLAKMAIAEMFKDTQRDPPALHNDFGDVKFETLKLRVYHTWTYAGSSMERVYEYKVMSAVLDKNGQRFTFNDDERKLIQKAFDKWLELAEAYKVNKVENDRQQKAVDTIASFFETKEKPDGNVHTLVRPVDETRQVGSELEEISRAG